MARKLKSDKLLFTATLLLVCTSVVMVYSASAVMANEVYQSQYLFLFKHLTFALLGLFLVQLIMRIDYRKYREPAVIWTCLGVVAVGLIAVLFGQARNGAKRWLNLGGLGIQPSELAKISVIMFVAALLERRMDRIDEPGRALLPIGAVLGGVIGLVLLEPDLGTAVSIVTIASVMIFAAGINYKYVASLVLTALPTLFLLVWTSEYRWKRVQAFLIPGRIHSGAG